MPITPKEKDGTVTLEIEGALSIYETAALRNELLLCFDLHERLKLDLKKVTDCDAAGLQLLCSVGRSATEMKKSFGVVGVSQVVNDTLQSAGFDPDDVLNTSPKP